MQINYLIDNYKAICLAVIATANASCYLARIANTAKISK